MPVAKRLNGPISDVARTLELSVAVHSASATDEFRALRREGIQAMSGVERHVAMGLDRLAELHPKVARVALDVTARKVARLSYIGHGAWSSVYRSGDEVLKILRRTTLLSESERVAFAESRTELCQKAAAFLGPIGVKQSYASEDHPFGGYRAVIARQDYVAGANLDLCVLNDARINEQGLDGFCEQYSWGVHALAGLLDATVAMSDNHGVVPDINGQDNFRIADDQLRLIDAEPIARSEHPAVYDLILRQTDLLHTWLQGHADV